MIGRVINVNLSQFSNIRCLKLECPLKKVLAQLNSNISTHLKHVFISNLVQFKLDIKSHRNLKRMTIPVVDMILPWNDQVFDNYLCCVPNSEKLVIYRSIFISKADEFLLEYDWSASKIALYLLSARRFYFYFQIIQIEEKFVNIDINP
ncbi:unnamed protein product [Rotaria socialis]|uniref:Uncharacterized protein n=1 Tax=Rotaria socialis TaxID=392032 RepID=A0A820DX50_9BILA|nr:unnamed protein product [Rotaria socialis]CAF4477196.1 unnamed protein product [Rotaria socialis]CAF4482022.1 unnamed protein product [Rotaria socialis]